MAPELREMLRDAASAPKGPFDLDDVRRRADAVRRTRRTRATVAAVLVVAVVAVTTPAVVARLSTPSNVDFADDLPKGEGLPQGWSRIGDMPIAPRTNSAIVWTGADIVVWGGMAVGGSVAVLTDGAAYNPARGEWREIADAPLPAAGFVQAVWTGDEMLVWANTRDRTSASAAYDPETDRWRGVARPPVSALGGSTVVWTGQEMIVWGGHDRVGRPSNDGAAYDPTTDTWRVLADSPLEPRFNQGGVWTGRELVIWGGNATLEEGAVASWDDGASYDPSTDTWRRLPAAPVSGREPAETFWTGTEALFLGGSLGPGGATILDGAAYDPKLRRWRRLPATDVPMEYFGWAGDRVLGWSPDHDPSPLALPVRGPRWVPIPEPGTKRRPLLGHGPSMVWTGRHLVVISGHGWRDRGIPDGAMYDPAAVPVESIDDFAPTDAPGLDPDVLYKGRLWPPFDPWEGYGSGAAQVATSFGREMLGWRRAACRPLKKQFVGGYADWAFCVLKAAPDGPSTVLTLEQVVEGTWFVRSAASHPLVNLSIDVADDGRTITASFKGGRLDPRASVADLIVRFPNQATGARGEPGGTLTAELPLPATQDGNALVILRDRRGRVIEAYGRVLQAPSAADQ